MGDKNFKWYYGRDEEFMNGGFATKDEAIDAGKNEYGDETFYIVEADKSVCKVPHIPVIEHIIDWNDECWGEDGCEHEWTIAQENELRSAVDAAIQNWLDKYPPATYTFGDIRSRSAIVTPVAPTAEAA